MSLQHIDGRCLQSIGQRPPSTDAATGMMMVMAQPVQSEPGPVTQVTQLRPTFSPLVRRALHHRGQPVLPVTLCRGLQLHLYRAWLTVLPC